MVWSHARVHRTKKLKGHMRAHCNHGESLTFHAASPASSTGAICAARDRALPVPTRLGSSTDRRPTFPLHARNQAGDLGDGQFGCSGARHASPPSGRPTSCRAHACTTVTYAPNIYPTRFGGVGVRSTTPQWPMCAWGRHEPARPPGRTGTTNAIACHDGRCCVCILRLVGFSTPQF